ncbi:MAG: universal stress protein [Myxococcota bacterium]
MSQALAKRFVVGLSWAVEDEDGASMEVAASDLRALTYASELAQKAGGEVRVVHVIDFLSHRREGDAGDLDDVAQKAMGGLAAEHPSTTAVVRRGQAWRELIREAVACEADAIVVAPRRDNLGLVDRLFYGSTARRLLRYAPTSVLVVPPSVELPVRSVIALLGGTEEGDLPVIEAARAYADHLGAERHALHCLEYPSDIALHRLPQAKDAIARYHAEVREQAEQMLHRALGDGWQLHFSDDWVVRTAPKVADAQNIGLVVMSARKQHGIAGLLGHTADKLLERDLEAAVLVVRPPGWREQALATLDD